MVRYTLCSAEFLGALVCQNQFFRARRPGPQFLARTAELLPVEDHLIDGLSSALSLGLRWMSNGNHCHQLAVLRYLEGLFNLIPVPQDLAKPYPAQTQMMDSKQHILDTGSDGLNVFHAIIACGIVQKDGDTDRCISYDVAISRLLGNLLSQILIANNDKPPGLIVEPRRGPCAHFDDLLDYSIIHIIGLKLPDTAPASDALQQLSLLLCLPCNLEYIKEFYYKDFLEGGDKGPKKSIHSGPV